jgi:hypothetical protein
MHNSHDHGHARCAQGQRSRVSGPRSGLNSSEHRPSRHEAVQMSLGGRHSPLGLCEGMSVGRFAVKTGATSVATRCVGS